MGVRLHKREERKLRRACCVLGELASLRGRLKTRETREMRTRRQLLSLRYAGRHLACMHVPCMYMNIDTQMLIHRWLKWSTSPLA